jgi:hypothetical protein
MTDGDSHYWNKLPGGREIDLTSDQFKKIPDKPKRETMLVRSRQRVLSYPNTVRRYGKLLQNIGTVMAMLADKK